MPGIMHDDDGFGPFRALQCGVLDGHQRFVEPVDIDEYRRSPDIKGAIGGGDEAERRHQHLVPWADAEGHERKMETRGARADSGGVSGTMLHREGLLEGPDAI